MEHTDHLDELLICRLDARRRMLEPSSLIIFGASGDLTARKLIPALYQLFIEKQLPNPFRIVGFARSPKTDAMWRDEMSKALQKHSRSQPIDAKQWEAFGAMLSYVQGDYGDVKSYKHLGERLSEGSSEALRRNALFYLAIPPSEFAQVAEQLHEAKLLAKGDSGQSWQRVVVEKPFGHDLPSAQKLNAELTRFVHEKQIYRIDHYLGKETVQNVPVFQFNF
jgi:glucose-6-phosphate 1-dehydrogenase